MSIINVISAPNASDADAATYAISATPSGATLPDSILFSDGVLKINGLTGQYGSTSVTNFRYDGHDLFINGHGGLGGVLLDIPLADQSPDQGTTLEVSRLGDTFYVTEGTVHMPAGAALLTGSAVAPVPPAAQPVVPQPPPAAALPVAAADGSTGQSLTPPVQAYAGPVPGLEQQVIMLDARNLNITATRPNFFLHTGSGNDAIAAHSGSNVLDGGTGSNFLTAGTGTDTFFVDARGASADTWSTVSHFHGGDAATLWGVSASTPAQWLDGQGAASNTGLTLHAGTAGGPTASLTLAGFSSADVAAGRITTTFGHDAASGSDYLYIHAS